jgi:RsiW-degrading membrane proteinase PrsW (M82 family)
MRAASEQGSSRWHSASVRLSQVFPLLSSGTRLQSKAFLLPAAATVITVAILAGSISNLKVYIWTLSLYLSAAAFYLVYQLCGKPKPWWVLVGAGGVTFLLLVLPGVWEVFAFLFRRVFPGELPIPPGSSVMGVFARYLFGAGFAEELFKAIPVLAAATLTNKMRGTGAGVRDPLDGVLLGAASAIGFALYENMFDKLPELQREASNYLIEKLGAVPSSVREALSAEFGWLVALTVAIPRTLGFISGHVAYSGYLGYAIGLAVQKPKRAPKILLSAYLISTAVHALWDTAAYFEARALLAPLGILSYALLATAILKARQMLNLTGSVRSPLVFTEPVLRIGARAIPIRAGHRIRCEEIEGLSPVSDDNVVAEITPNPTDESKIGLKNLSQTIWIARKAGGEPREVAPGRSIHLVPGLRIQFGIVEGEVQQ